MTETAITPLMGYLIEHLGDEDDVVDRAVDEVSDHITARWHTEAEAVVDDDLVEGYDMAAVTDGAKLEAGILASRVIAFYYCDAMECHCSELECGVNLYHGF